MGFIKIFTHEQNPPRQQISALFFSFDKVIQYLSKEQNCRQFADTKEIKQGKNEPFSTAGVLSLTMLRLLLNNHTLWPSISGSPPFRIFHSCHQASHIGSDQRQFANALYIAYIIMLYILMAICYCKALPPCTNPMDIHQSFRGGQGRDMEYLHWAD